MITAEFQLAPAEAGVRLDQFLAARVPALSRSRLQQLVKEGFVLVNGRSPKASSKLRAGDHVSRERAPGLPPGEDGGRQRDAAAEYQRGPDTDVSLTVNADPRSW